MGTIQEGQDPVATTWRPDQGEHPRTIVGRVIDVRSVEGSYGAYPLVELEQDDGVAWVFHAFRDVAQSELVSCGPQIGEKVSISYGGIPAGKSYHLYKVRRVGVTASRVNWAKFGDAEPDLPVEPVKPAEKSAADRAEETYGDDAPWE